MSDSIRTTIEDGIHLQDPYFEPDFKLQAVWLGLTWLLLAAYPTVVFRAGRPGYNCVLSVCSILLTSGEWHAWNVFQYGFGGGFFLLGIFWLLSYIQSDNRIMQKIYYRSIAWMIPISWIFCLWVMIAFIVGGT